MVTYRSTNELGLITLSGIVVDAEGFGTGGKPNARPALFDRLGPDRGSGPSAVTIASAAHSLAAATRAAWEP